jgi:hypothetical protein
MEKFSLDAIAREQTKRAAAASSGRSAETGRAADRQQGEPGRSSLTLVPRSAQGYDL